MPFAQRRFMLPKPPRAVFLDKDGTLIDDVPYNVRPELVRFADGAIDACRLLSRLGFQLVVVTNQPGIAIGRFDRAALSKLESHLTRALASAGIELKGFYACTHAPTKGPVLGCLCRKPAPGLLLQGARVHGIDLAQSWMVGDILDDVEAGCRAGCRTILLDIGHETVWRQSPMRTPTFKAASLLQAAQLIEAHA
jgi:D-glycero-D-manno-heptose 1,7-bisphosphate phosphatase